MGFISFLVQTGGLLTGCDIGPSWNTRTCAPQLVTAAMSASTTIQLSSSWDVLGPFQIGTREAAWGADPLEYHGGFSVLQPNSNVTFPSSLPKDGRARWSHVEGRQTVHAETSARTTLNVSFSEVDWTFLQTVYGWSATQWQAWARTELIVNAESAQNVVISTPQLFEFRLDGHKYVGGDFFAYNRAPAVVSLSPGKHVFEVRLVRDVRSMGGIGQPSMEVNLEARLGPATGLEIGDVLVSDVVGGKLSSPWASVPLRNTGNSWIVVNVTSVDASIMEMEVQKYGGENRHLRIAPGQTLPVPLDLYLKSSEAMAAFGRVAVRQDGDPQGVVTQSLDFAIPIRRVSLYDTHKLTHLHPSGVVSYSVLRAPSQNVDCPVNATKAPVALMLHGAGVEADSDVVKKTFDSLPDVCAWVLLPSGGSTWSSDDWHTWGSLDVMNSIYYIQVWLETHGWKGIGVDIFKLLVIGHSNGGQGTWFTLSHHPSFVLAAAPLSGYLSIPLYVPTTWWRPADPSKQAAIEFARSSYSHQLLAPNFAHIPIYQQHGELDDNVPAYHSALMYQLINETGSFSNYDVPKGKPHWWEEVATEPNLKDFYRKVLAKPQLTTLSEVDGFDLIIADPGEHSGRFGVKVTYLQEQGRLGKLKVSKSDRPDTWRFVPENVMAFEIDDSSEIESVSIEGASVGAVSTFNKLPNETGPRKFWLHAETGIWTQKDPASPPTRSFLHFGGLNAILRTSGPFLINSTLDSLLPLAIQTSRNLNTYLGAEADILSPLDYGKPSDPDKWTYGHLITIALGQSLPQQASHAFRYSSTLERQTSTGWLSAARKAEPHGAIFLRPNKRHGLELVIWGSDYDMVEMAARLLPMVSGTGQPDWIVCKKEMAWKGLDGCEVGWFDAWWRVQGS